MFNKILIANRGEIACRVAATARRMGIRTVAVYSDADASAKHVAACDEAVHIGGSAPRDSYLQWQRILQAAQATGAQAVHPGYGFLSENDAFAQACADAGLVFIGPSPAAIRAMGLKAESKQLMATAGVPLVPGYHGADQDPALLQREADSIGYPVLIKASAGGGGKGMRAVDKSEDFAAALASCQREARNSFGDDAVLIERYVQRPRHIEIQVFGDTQGNFVYLHERDCSVQRRHQKVLEEAPAPGMTPALRQQMGEAAVAAARAVDYVGAGTVEFIVETSSDARAAHALPSLGATTPPPGRPKAGLAPSGGSEGHAVPSVGAISAAPLGNAAVLPISWMYCRMMGSEGLQAATEVAILSANYISRQLKDHYPTLYANDTGDVAHECILDLRPLKESCGVMAEDVAKRLMDYGFHAPTLSFPVPNTLMVEPTESESLAELDRFIEAMIAIRAEIRRIESGEWPKDNNPLKHAPHTAAALLGSAWDRPYPRELGAFPLASLKHSKYWPPISRIDNVYGDRHLFCSCVPVSAYS